jgi:hypothetical protein
VDRRGRRNEAARGVIAPTLPRRPAARPLNRPAPPAAAAHPLLRLHNVSTAVSALLMLLMLRGDTLGELALLMAVPILGLATFAADRRYLPTLLLLCIPALGVHIEPGTSPFVFPEVVKAVPLGGMEMSSGLMVLVAAFGRVAFELLRGANPWRGVVPRWVMRVFLLALVPAFMGAMLAQGMGMNRWSFGFRAMLAIGGMFWGMLVARRSDPARLAGQLATIVFVASALLVVRFLNDMFVFLVLGLAGGLMPHYVSRRRWLQAGTLAAAALVGVLTLSLTTAAQVLVALGAVMVAGIRSPGIRRTVLRLSVAAGVVASGAMIWLVVQLRGKTLLDVAQAQDSLMAYATFKLLGDRGPLWLAALQQIANGPYWVVPAGRPLRPENFNYGYEVYLWEFGSHNGFLELLRQAGLIAGGIGIVLMLWIITAVARVLGETRSPTLRGLGAGFLGVVVVGLTTGNFPVQDIGFFLWGVGGMVVAAAMQAREETEGGGDVPPPPPKPVRARPTPRAALPAGGAA